jgi:choline dehydrogenase-like flavoprotein
MIDPSPSKRYQIVVVGSGFGSSFYLHEALARLPASARCLVLERGRLLTPEWQRQHQRNSDIDADTAIERPPGHKHWQFTIAHGGGTNCWWGVTPRLHPSDFQLRSRYGVGRDWPIDYAELEPWYARAEAIMAVAGPGDNQQQFPRSTPYP